jgi:hypothetical protein
MVSQPLLEFTVGFCLAENRHDHDAAVRLNPDTAYVKTCGKHAFERSGEVGRSKF